MNKTLRSHTRYPHSLKALARSYNHFPRFLLASAVCNSASSHLPTVFLGNFFGAGVTGAYTLGNRTLTLVDLFGTVVGQAFFPEAARSVADNRSPLALWKQTTWRLFLFAIVFFPIMFVVAPDLFTLFFGPEWRVSGEIVRWLIPLFFARFLTIPSAVIPVVLGQRAFYLYRNLTLLLFIALALMVGWKSHSIEVTLAVYTFVYCCYYGLDAYLAVRMMKQRFPSPDPVLKPDPTPQLFEQQQPDET